MTLFLLKSLLLIVYSVHLLPFFDQGVALILSFGDYMVFVCSSFSGFPNFPVIFGAVVGVPLPAVSMASFLGFIRFIRFVTASDARSGVTATS